jgi:N-acetylmuramoyl-L-alanine amidase
MTAVLVENGFMGNPEDFKKIFINTDNYVAQLVPAYTKAICRFFNISYKEVKQMSELTPAQVEIQKEAIRLGLTDGKNPHREPNQMYVWQVMIPLARKVEELEKKVK